VLSFDKMLCIFDVIHIPPLVRWSAIQGQKKLNIEQGKGFLGPRLVHYCNEFYVIAPSLRPVLCTRISCYLVAPPAVMLLGVSRDFVMDWPGVASPLRGTRRSHPMNEKSKDHQLTIQGVSHEFRVTPFPWPGEAQICWLVTTASDKCRRQV
jgi:hypothetical protein